VGAGDAGYALVVGAWMAGMVAGATALARRVPASSVAAGALVAFGVQGVGVASQAAWAVLPVAVAGYLVGGLGHAVKNVLLRALIAVRVPPAAHGRAFAAYNAVRSAAELGRWPPGASSSPRSSRARRWWSRASVRWWPRSPGSSCSRERSDRERAGRDDGPGRGPGDPGAGAAPRCSVSTWHARAT